MPEQEIVTNPIRFREEFLSQASQSKVDEQYGATLRVMLYYIWRGAFQARRSMLQNQVQMDIGFICLSAYKALLPIIQMIRLGYPSDAFILLRALMERIALLGYLHNSRDLIPKYVAGKTSLQGKAMMWAKAHAPQNWMRLYSELSNIAHSRITGTAGHILGSNAISRAFRSTKELPATDDFTLVDELLALVCYAIIATDTFTKEILGHKGFEIFPADKKIILHLPPEDLIGFQSFLNHFIEKHQKAVKV